MKKNYLRRNNKSEFFKKISILILVFVVSLFLISALNGLLMRFLAPIWDAENSLVLPVYRASLPNSIPVLTRPPQSPYDVIIIDRKVPIESEVGGDLPAMPEQGDGRRGGYVLGKVVNTFDKTSRVLLFSSPGEKTQAVLERTGMLVTLTGRGAGNFRIEVPREEVVVVGDRILSISTEPKLVGVIEGVRVKPTDAFKEILAPTPVNIFSLTYVSTQ